MKDDERRELLLMSDSQLMDIARFCNRYPNIDLTIEVLDSNNVGAGEGINVLVSLERDLEGRTEVHVDAPKYPKAKEEGWRLVLIAVRRLTLQRTSMVKLDFTAPTEAGKKTYALYLCDSHLASRLMLREQGLLKMTIRE